MQKLDHQYHIHCVPGDVGRYVILPGDPGRCEKIAALFDDAHFVAQNREYTVYTGTLLGEKVSVCSTGIGGPSAPPSPWRSCTTSARTPLSAWAPAAASIWTCSPATWWWPPAPSALSTPAGSTRPSSIPPWLNFDVTTALVQASRALGKRTQVGVVQCKDAFYGQHSPGPHARVLRTAEQVGGVEAAGRQGQRDGVRRPVRGG